MVSETKKKFRRKKERKGKERRVGGTGLNERRGEEGKGKGKSSPSLPPREGPPEGDSIPIQDVDLEGERGRRIKYDTRVPYLLYRIRARTLGTYKTCTSSVPLLSLPSLVPYL